MGGMKDEGATGPRDCRIRCVDTNNHQTIKTSHHPLLPLSSLTKKKQSITQPNPSSTPTLLVSPS